MLSPGIRQVIHALLTRPPLSYPMIWASSPQRDISVRLACVKHAASVHPEPGSNSRFYEFKDFNGLLISWLHACMHICWSKDIRNLIISEQACLASCDQIEIRNVLPSRTSYLEIRSIQNKFLASFFTAFRFVSLNYSLRIFQGCIAVQFSRFFVALLCGNKT